jgi:hypothetical protein
MALSESDKELKRRMDEQMRAVLVPHLESLGYRSIGGKSRQKFKPRWVRDRGNEIDAIDFQWNSLARPSFGINFRSFDHPDDLAKCRSDPKSIEPADFGMKAYMKPNFGFWFKAGILSNFTGGHRSVSIAIAAAKIRLTELSDFLTGGLSTPLFKDSFSWDDERLPDNPPPWTDGWSASQ